MVDFSEILDKINGKEFIAITGGIVFSRIADNLMANMEPSKRDLVKVGGGLAATYLFNDMAEKNPENAEILGLLGLAATTVYATPVANRISIEVAKMTKAPVEVVASKVPQSASAGERVRRASVASI